MTPAVTVVVPARDAATTLPATLDALARQEGVDGGIEVIVVDNGSHDDTAAVAEDHPLRPHVIRRARGQGPGAARNDGAAAAQAPVLAFTDSDCAPHPRWLAAGLAAVARGADLVQGYVRPPEDAHPGPFDHTLWVTWEYGLYETANLLVRRDWFERAGGFQDWADVEAGAGGSARPFGEDVLFAWRARRAGAQTAFADDAIVYHLVFPGTVSEYLRERRRDGNFAALAKHVPELRRGFFYGRWFLNARSAAFDVAALALAAGALRRSPALVMAALPYALLVGQESRRRAGRTTPRVALAVAAGDVVGCVSLVEGSLRARTLVL